MRKKIILYSVILILLSSVITGLFAYFTAREQYYNQAEIQLKKLADIFQYNVNRGISFAEASSTLDNSTDVRVTVVKKNGEVVLDTRAASAVLHNHEDRPEIKDAFNFGSGSSIRFSETENKNYIYYARLITGNDGSFAVRMSVPLESLNVFTRSTISFIIVGLSVAFIISSLLSVWFTNKFTKPIKEISSYAKTFVPVKGKKPEKIIINTGDEISELADSVNRMVEEIYSGFNNVKDANDRLNAIVNSISGVVIAFDTDKKIMLVNSEAKDIFGISESELVGKIYSDFIRNRDIKDFVNNADMTTKVKEIKILNNWYLIRKSPIKSDDGITGTVMIMDDITNIKKLERMRSEFVSNVTHELKTPLTSIKGFIETLKAGAIDDKEASGRFLDIIEIETERLGNLISDLLVLSRIEAMPQELHIEQCDLKKIVSYVVDVAEPIAAKKNIAVETNIEAGAEAAYANPDRLKQLLINLVGNSIEYNNEGGWVKVNISRRNDNIIFAVSDNGIGIEEKYWDRIFERFYTVNKGRSRKNSGTGLGLSIVKHIAMLYEGTVNIKSELGKGSEFTVILPIANKNENNKDVD